MKNTVDDFVLIRHREKKKKRPNSLSVVSYTFVPGDKCINSENVGTFINRNKNESHNTQGAGCEDHNQARHQLQLWQEPAANTN